MSHEGTPTPEIDHEFLQQAELILAEVGEEYFHEQFGLGREELQKTVTFGDHLGSAAAMLIDGKCPIGGKLAEAYREGGLKAVRTKVTQLSEFAPEFNLPIAASSWQREAQRNEPPGSDFLDQPRAEEAKTPVEAFVNVRPGLAEPHARAMLEAASLPDPETTKEAAAMMAPDDIAKTKTHSSKVALVPKKALLEKTKPRPEPLKVEKDIEEQARVRTKHHTLSPEPSVSSPQLARPSKIVRRSLELSTAKRRQKPAPVASAEPTLNLPIVLLPTAAIPPKPEIPERLFALPVELEAPEQTELYHPGTVPEMIALASPEQVDALVVSMPEIIHDQLADFMQTSESDTVAAAEELIVSIAVAADRLHELAMLDALDGPEAEQIEALIREWYKELLIKADITFDEETIDQLIEIIKAEVYGQDEGTHERKQADSALPDGVISSNVREQEIGRVAVRQLMPT